MSLVIFITCFFFIFIMPCFFSSVKNFNTPGRTWHPLDKKAWWLSTRKSTSILKNFEEYVRIKIGLSFYITPCWYSELEWSGTIVMQILNFASFAENEDSIAFSEQFFIGGFFWKIMAIRYRYVFYTNVKIYILSIFCWH